MYTKPLLLDTDVPVLKNNEPLNPTVPPFVDRITTAPLVVAVPSPLTRLNKPPVCTVLRPAITRTSPPALLVPLPTVIATAPPRPAVAAPVPSHTCPLLPLLELPELKINTPETPFVPALALRIVTEPLVVAVPSPDATLTAPPVCTVLRPLFT